MMHTAMLYTAEEAQQVAQELANALSESQGHTWHLKLDSDAPEVDNTPHLCRRDGSQLVICLVGGFSGRWHVEGSVPENLRRFFDWHVNEIPRASFDASRPMAHIARHIQRRVCDPMMGLLEELSKVQGQEARYRARVESELGRLVEASGYNLDRVTTGQQRELDRLRSVQGVHLENLDVSVLGNGEARFDMKLSIAEAEALLCYLLQAGAFNRRE